MKKARFWDRTILFLKNIPSTFKESCKWFVMTYLMPLIQFLIIWGIGHKAFTWSLSNLNIVLVTNASLLSAILLILGTLKKDRSISSILTIISYVLTVVLFSFSMVELNKQIALFDLDVYQWGTLISFVLSLILGLMCKYDEVKARRLELANAGKSRTTADINNETFEL